MCAAPAATSANLLRSNRAESLQQRRHLIAHVQRDPRLERKPVRDAWQPCSSILALVKANNKAIIRPSLDRTLVAVDVTALSARHGTPARQLPNGYLGPRSPASGSACRPPDKADRRRGNPMHVSALPGWLWPATSFGDTWLGAMMQKGGNSMPLRKQPRHPARGQRCREGQAQRRACACRYQYAAFDQRGDDTAGLTFARADDGGSVAAR